MAHTLSTAFSHLNSFSVYISDCIFGNISPGFDKMLFNNGPATLVGDEIIPESGQRLNVNLASQSFGYSTSVSGCFPMSTISPQASICFMPTNSLYGVNDTSWSWSYAGENIYNFFPQSDSDLLQLEPLATARHNQSQINGYELQGPPTSGHSHAPNEITVHKTKHQAAKPQLVQRHAPRKFGTHLDSMAGVIVRPTVKCDYDGCSKAFRRNEHLKRHKQT